MKIYSFIKQFPDHAWENLQPFVFKKSDPTPCLLDVLDTKENLEHGIHPPFPFFSIEVENGVLMSTFGDIRTKLHTAKKNDIPLTEMDFTNHELMLLKQIYESLDHGSIEHKKNYMNLIFEEIYDGYDIFIDLIIIKELNPDQFEFIVSINSRARKNVPEAKTVLLCTESSISFLETGELITDQHAEFAMFKTIYHDTYSLAHFFVEKIYTNAQGKIETHHFVKRKINGLKTKFKFSNIIYVSNGKNKTSNNSGISKNIEWLNSWSVRGHWRSMHNPDAIGKNRIGERTIIGKTWIAPYRKGEGNLINKVRKV
jgi:hypothetical protein